MESAVIIAAFFSYQVTAPSRSQRPQITKHQEQTDCAGNLYGRDPMTAGAITKWRALKAI